MNPYRSPAAPAKRESQALNATGGALRSWGYFVLVPAILFALLIFVGTVAYGFEDGLTIPFRMLWPLGMGAFLVVFLVSSTMMTHPQLRFLMYASGAATVFCAAIFDTYNTVALNAYNGRCGNPVMAGMMFRVASFSTYAGVPLVSLAGLVGLSVGKHERRTDEPSDPLETSASSALKSSSTARSP